MSLAVIAPVYGNADTLAELHRRLTVALAREDWCLQLVVDACPFGSGAAARRLARSETNVQVIHHDRNRGQHAALASGLRATGAADCWVVLDADLQDPPEALGHVQPRPAHGRVQRHDPVLEEPADELRRLVPGQVVQHQQHPGRPREPAAGAVAQEAPVNRSQVSPNSTRFTPTAIESRLRDQPNSCCSGIISTLGAARNPAAPSSAMNDTVATATAGCRPRMRRGRGTVTTPSRRSLLIGPPSAKHRSVGHAVDNTPANASR